MTKTNPGLGALAEEFAVFAQGSLCDRAQYDRLTGIALEILAVLELAGIDDAERYLGVGYLIGSCHGQTPEVGATLIALLTTPGAIRRCDAEAPYRALTALIGQACDEALLPFWLTPPFVHNDDRQSHDNVARGLKGIAFGYAAYNSEFMTGSRSNYETLANMLVAVQETMAPNDFADEKPVWLTIGYWMGARYDHAPEPAAALMALFLDPEANAAAVKALYRILCQLARQAPDEFDLPHWVNTHD